MYRSGKQTAGKVTREFARMGPQMQTVGRSMSMWLTAPLVGAGVLAVKTAADYETLRQSMDILNGSAEEGARNFERLKDFSARTPFQLQDLASAQNMLQGFGQSADDAFESIKMIGDISAVSGGSIRGIGIAFGQAAAEGRLMSRDIRQLINQGVPAIKLLADTMGVAQSEIFDLASQGEISFEILQRAFREATSEGGMFADGMEKQSKTTGGLFSTLKDNVSIAMGSIGNDLSETLDIKEVMTGLTDSIREGVTWFGNLSDQSKFLSVRLLAVSAAIPPIIWGGGKLINTITTLRTAFIALNAVMLRNPMVIIGVGVTLLIGHITGLNQAVVRMVKDFFTFEESSDEVTSSLNDQRKAAEQLGKSLDEIGARDAISQMDRLATRAGEINKEIERLGKEYQNPDLGVEDRRNIRKEIGALRKEQALVLVQQKALNVETKGRLDIQLALVQAEKESLVNISSLSDEERKRLTHLNEQEDSLQAQIEAQKNLKKVSAPMNELLEENKKAMDELIHKNRPLTEAENDKLASLGEQNRRLEKQIKIREMLADPSLIPKKPTISTPKFEDDILDPELDLESNMDIGERLFPVGSLGDAQDRLAYLKESLRSATDPETIQTLQSQIGSLNEDITNWGDITVDSGRQAAMAMGALGNSIGGVVGQLISGKKEALSFGNILKSVAPALINVLTGGTGGFGASLASGIFGGIFHQGGIIPGSGERIIKAKGGEGVFTPSQMKAMGGMQGGGGMQKIYIEVPVNLDGREIDRNQRNIQYEVNR